MNTYEKKYKDALERASKYNFDDAKQVVKDLVTYIFPELKESEDEKIRKWLISQLKIKSDDTNFDLNIMIDKAISWLEKQGEQKPSDEDMKEALRTEYEKGRADAFAEMQKEWSEDDEKRLQSCINILKAKSLMGKVDTANTMWLKSLKQRIGGKL